MGEPERAPEPYDPEKKPDPDAPPPSSIRKADWVVGADEGLQAELDHLRAGEAPSKEAPRLSRPEDPDAGMPRPLGLTGTGQFPKPTPRPVETHAPDPMPSWDRGASSVPMMRRGAVEGSPQAPANPELAREFPMDDAEERARVAATVAAQHKEAAAIAARPHEVVKSQEFEIPELEPAWWMRLGVTLRVDRRLQLALGVALLALLVYSVWPRSEKTISIAHLKEHAERYADTPVRVGGRVSEVFTVGGSWAYTVVQGRDTIVVFSRTRGPKPREQVVVVGTLSTGYLDGQSRVAIFESTR